MPAYEINGLLVEEPYTGHLSVADRATLRAILSNSAVEKPEKPVDYEGSQENWDNDWDKALACALTTNQQSFDTDLPSDTHPDIKTTLKCIFDYLNPARIDRWAFITPGLTIGHVYDDVQQHFYGLLKDKNCLPVENLKKLTPAFYEILVGKLSHGTVNLNTETSRVHYALLMDLVDWFHDFEQHIASNGQVLEFIPARLKRIVTNWQSYHFIFCILSDDILKTEAQENILNDFYAITSATTSAVDIEEFALRYKILNVVLQKFLIEHMTPFMIFMLEIYGTETQLPYLVGLHGQTAAFIIHSVSLDRLAILCELEGFFRHPHLEQSIKTLQIDRVHDLVFNSNLGADTIVKIFKALSPESAQYLMGSCEVEALETILAHVPVRNHLLNTFSAILLNKLGVDYCKSFIEDVNALCSVLRGLGADSQILLLRLLGPDFIVELSGDLSQLMSITTVFKSDSFTQQFFTLLGLDRCWAYVKDGYDANKFVSLLDYDLMSQWIDTLGPRLMSVIKNSRDLGMLLSAENGNSKLSLIVKTYPNQIRALIQDSEDLSRLMKYLPSDMQMMFIEILGPKIVDIMSRGSFDFHNEDMLKRIINRACIYHSRYQMKRPFSPDTIIKNIESIFKEMSERPYYGESFYCRSSVFHARYIIRDARENPSPTRVLERLRYTLHSIDADADNSVDLLRAKPNGQLAMRIMYCIEQLNYHLSPEKPALLPAQKKPWKEIMPSGAMLGAATAVGIGLALAYSPISMMGTLHLTVGAIIGLSLAAACITMAVYTVAMHEWAPKKDFTDKGCLMSWSVFSAPTANSTQGQHPVVQATPESPLPIARFPS